VDQSIEPRRHEDITGTDLPEEVGKNRRGSGGVGAVLLVDFDETGSYEFVE